MSGNKSPQQIAAYQQQWNATKAMYRAEVDFMTSTYNSKNSELLQLQASTQWANLPLQEKTDLRNSVNQAYSQLQAIIQEITDAWINFLSVNPDAKGNVAF